MMIMTIVTGDLALLRWAAGVGPVAFVGFGLLPASRRVLSFGDIKPWRAPRSRGITTPSSSWSALQQRYGIDHTTLQVDHPSATIVPTEDLASRLHSTMDPATPPELDH